MATCSLGIVDMFCDGVTSAFSPWGKGESWRMLMETRRDGNMFLKKINRLHSFRGKWSRDRCGHSITLRALLLLGVMGSSEGPGWWGAEPTAPQCCPGSESLAGETAQW